MFTLCSQANIFYLALFLTSTFSAIYLFIFEYPNISTCFAHEERKAKINSRSNKSATETALMSYYRANCNHSRCYIAGITGFVVFRFTSRLWLTNLHNRSFRLCVCVHFTLNLFSIHFYFTSYLTLVHTPTL